jgi:type I restriction enzyme S subunit
MNEGAESPEAAERSTTSVMSETEAREGYKWIQLGPKSIEIPEEWEVRRFGDVFEKRREKITPDGDEMVRYVGLDDIASDNIHLQDYDENGTERSSTRGFREGDVLFGKLRPYLNKAAVAPFDGICSSDIIPIYAPDESIDNFLLYLMHSKVMRDRAISTMSGTNLPRTSWGDLASAQFPYPSLPEQHRIAEVLSTVDEQIQQTRKIIQNIKELKRGLFNDLLTSGVREDTELSDVKIGAKRIEVPTSWDVKRVRDILSDEKGAIRTGPFGSKLKNEHHVPEGIKLYEQRHIYEEDFEIGNRHVTEKWYDSELTSYNARPKDVLITLQGTVGEAAVIPEHAEEGVINPKLIRIRADDSIVLPEYLSRFLDDSQISNQQIESLSHGAVVSGLNVKTVGEIKVPLPPISEQKTIVELVDIVNEKLSNETDHEQELQEFKRGLMQDLLTGTVRVPESIEVKD